MKENFALSDKHCIFCRSFNDGGYCPIKGQVVDRLNNCEVWEEGR